MGKTSPVITDSIGIGPYSDIPVGALVGTSGSEQIDYAWFEDDFVPAVQCGAIEVPCPPPLEPITATLDSPGCGQWRLHDIDQSLLLSVDRVDIIGSIGTVSYFRPGGNPGSANPVTSTLAVWDADFIYFVDSQWEGETITAYQFFGPGGVPTYVIDDVADVNVAVCLPDIQFLDTPDCERLRVHGAALDDVNTLYSVANAKFYYNPLGPDAGADAPAVINSWTSTLIDITDPGLGGVTVNSFNMYAGPLNTNFFNPPGTVNEPNLLIDGCVLVGNGGQPYSPVCERIHWDGSFLTRVDHIQLQTSIGQIDYYQQPNAFPNPVTSGVITWGASFIDIADTQLAGVTINSYKMLSPGNVIDFTGIVPTALLIGDCP